MTRLYRRVMLFSTSIVFLALAPLIVLYAMGYRTNRAAVDPVPVGVVLLESFPRRADVRVGNAVVGRTPRAIPNIPAGNIEVALERAGYTTWRKRLPVEPGRITEVRSVRLFPELPQAAAIFSDAQQFALSPNGTLAAVVSTAGRLTVIDEEGAVLKEAVALRGPVRELKWAPSSSALLALLSNGAVEVIELGVVSSPPRLLPQLHGAETVTWDARVPSRLLVLSADGTLFAYSITNAARTTIATRVQEFVVSTRQIHTLTTAGAIMSYSLQGEPLDAITDTFDPPLSHLLATERGHLAAIRQDDSLVLLSDSEPQLIAPRVLAAQWSPDGNVLLVQTDPNALYVYNVSDERSPLPLEQLQLVVRLTDPLTQVQWFAGGQHVVYQVGDQVFITETDTRDRPLTYQVASTNRGNASATVGTDGKELWYLRETGPAATLVRHLLVLPEDL